MSLWPFTFYTLVGSLLWNVALVGAGYLLGENWERAGEPVDLLQNAVVIVIAVALGWFIWRRVLSARLHRQL
jgi:membrane protein DedA with SNARE-associated domain